MAENPKLESIYRQAQSALKLKEYDRASDLLRQILQIDETYKDASRLLAQSVKLKRRRWYNDPRLWGALGFVVIAALGFFFMPRMREFYAVQPAAPVTDSPSAALLPTAIATATETLLPAPTPVPLTWKRISLGQEFERDTVTAIVIDPKDPEVLYVGMENAGIYKSIDGGLSWRPAHYGLVNVQVETLLIDFQNSQILYAGTPSGIFKTEDGGENWFKFAEEIYLLMDPQDSSHLYKRDSDTIYESTDQGKSWESVYTSNEGCPGEILGWAIHPVDGNILFVGGGEVCESGVYISSDGGRAWTLLAKIAIRVGGFTIHDMGLDNLTIGLDKQGGYYLRLGAHASSFERGVKHYENGIWKTILELDDKPATFNSTGSVYFHCDTRLCKFNLEKRQRETLGNPDVGDFTLIAPSPFDPNIIYVGGKGMAVSKDGGLTWSKLRNGLGSTILHLESALEKPGTLYLFSGNCEGSILEFWGDRNWNITQPLYISINGGNTWDPSFQIGCYLLKDSDGSTLYRIGDPGPGWETGLIWRSSDSGKSWEKILTPHQVITLTTDQNQSGLLYLYTWETGFSSNKFFISGNYGNEWRVKDPPADLKPCYGLAVQFIDAHRPMAIDPDDGDHVLFIDEGRLQESLDSCESWNVMEEQPPYPLNEVAIDPNTPNTIYVGADSGAYISSDSGETWNQINDGLLGATVVYSIVVDKDGNVYAATPYGVFKLEGK